MADIWLAWLIGSPQSENGQSRRPRRFSGMLRLRYGERGHCGCPTRASHLEHFAKDQRAGQEMASCGDVAFCSCSSLLADASRGFLPSLRISAHRGRSFQAIVDGVSEERGRQFKLIVDDVSA